MSLILRHSKGNPRNSEGSFVSRHDRSVLFAYSRYSGTNWHDHCSADIWAVKSTDNGRTWDAPRLLLKNPAMSLMSVSLLRLQDERIAMIVLQKSKIPGWPEYVDCRPLIRFSSDDAQSWSEPIDIAGVPPSYFVVCNDRLIQLKNGRLILPGSYVRYKNDRTFASGIGIFFISDDVGATWRQTAECCYPPPHLSSGLQEPGVIELEDGRILAWFRTGGGCQYKAFSYDHGEHWTIPVPAPEFLSPAAPLSMKRNPDSGELIAVWVDYHPQRSVHFEDGIIGRTPLVMAKSHDEGTTWEDHRILEDAPDHGFAYTAMLFHDSRLLLGYCCGGKTECESMLQELKLSSVVT